MNNKPYIMQFWNAGRFHVGWIDVTNEAKDGWNWPPDSKIPKEAVIYVVQHDKAGIIDPDYVTEESRLPGR